MARRRQTAKEEAGESAREEATESKQQEAAETEPRRRRRRRAKRSKIGDRRHLKDSDEGVLRLKRYTSGNQVPGQDAQTLKGSKRGMRLRGPKRR